MDLRQRLLAAFQIEHKDHLEYMRSMLACAESRSLEPAELDEVFRRAHSLKGAARATDLRPIETLAHRMETLFGRVRSGELALDARLIGLVEQAMNAVEDWVAAYDGSASPVDTACALAALDGLLESRDIDAAPPPQAPPSADAPPPQTPPAAEEAPERPPPVIAEETVRISAANLDRLLRTAGELLRESHGQDHAAKRLRWIENELAKLAGQWSRLRHPSADGSRHAGSDEMGERVRTLAREARTARLFQQRTGWTLRQLAGGLRDEVQQARMLPAESVFGGFRKMMRDLARDVGKAVEFRAYGLDVRADRLVLQTLKDPVMHMLRNAIFHGIEPPETRAANGKPASGRVSLRFAIASNRLVLTIEDDGRGIDLSGIVETAVAQGFVSAEDADAMSQHDLVRYIFRPGFSTAQAVDDLAGRGMGMSVVYQAVARLNGSLEVPQKEGPGTTFRLAVPLSVATHRLMMVACQGRTFAIPAEGVDRLLRVRTDAIRSVEGKPVIVVDGRQLFLVTLARLLDLPEDTVIVQDGAMPVIVLRSGDMRVAVAVDSLDAIRDGIIQDLGFKLGPESKVAGGMLREDGDIVLVLSPFQLVEACRRPDRVGTIATAERTPVKKTPSILVVDDSFTTRTLEKSILEAHGYRVHLAVDGLEALSQLRTQSVDLVIADVQMPRLDGFGLLKEIKKDKAFAKLPVILVTSLESREDRERGLSLGADAYVIKRKFDQRELLDTIEQIL